MSRPSTQKAKVTRTSQNGAVRKSATPKTRSLSDVAARVGSRTGKDFVNLLTALAYEPEAVDPKSALISLKACSHLIKLADLQLRHGTSAGRGRQSLLQLTGISA